MACNCGKSAKKVTSSVSKKTTNEAKSVEKNNTTNNIRMTRRIIKRRVR